jgi:hypothetical protein
MAAVAAVAAVAELAVFRGELPALPELRALAESE